MGRGSAAGKRSEKDGVATVTRIDITPLANQSQGSDRSALLQTYFLPRPADGSSPINAFAAGLVREVSNMPSGKIVAAATSVMLLLVLALASGAEESFLRLPGSEHLTAAHPLGELAPRALDRGPDVVAALYASPRPTLTSLEASRVRYALEPAEIGPFTTGALLSSTFREQLSAAVTTVPAPVWRSLQRGGYRFVAARLVTDAVPRLRQEHPRGWPSDQTWENTDAVHVTQWRTLVVSELRRNKKGELVPAVRVERVVRHEVGHAFDALLGGGRYDYYSSSPEFIRLYDADWRRLDAAGRERLAYYVQAGTGAGRQETFAESFAEHLGGGSSPERAEQFLAAFPSVHAHVGQILARWK
jgi:hypothetical protein